MQKKNVICSCWLIFIVSMIILFFCFNKNEWIYFIALPNGVTEEESDNALWRINARTEKQELIWNNGVSAFLEVDDQLYIQESDGGIYRTDVDGTDAQLIYEGYTNNAFLIEENGWLFFSAWSPNEESSWLKAEELSFVRYHIETGEVEEFLQGTVIGLNFMQSTFVVHNDQFYTIGILEGRYGIINYDLCTGEQSACFELATGRKSPLVADESEKLYMTECGEYIVLMYLDYAEPGFVKEIYATPKGKPISEETQWEEVRFPDMQEGTAYPPHGVVGENAGYTIREAAHCGYVFHDGYVFYQDKNWNLNCRPLFGKKEEVIVYEGTALKEDFKGRVAGRSCSLSFGGKYFYYQFYTDIDEEEAANPLYVELDFYQPKPMKWDGYIGEKP